MLSASMIGNVASKYLPGAMADKIGAFKGVICMILTSLAGLVIILFNPGGIAFLMAGGFLYGTCLTVGSLGISMITQTLCGDKQYSSACSLITLPTSLSSAAALTLIGLMYDMTGSCSASVNGGMILLAVSLICLFVISRKGKGAQA